MTGKKADITINTDEKCPECGKPETVNGGRCLACMSKQLKKDVQDRVAQEAAAIPPADDDQKIDSKFIGQCLFANSEGDGLLYATLFRDQFLYVKNIQEWFKWTGHIWQLDKMNESLAAVAKVADIYLEEYSKLSDKIVDMTKSGEPASEIEKLQNKQKAILERVRQLRGDNRRTACLKFAHTIDKPLAITGDEFDKRPMLFPCANGVIDLETGKFKPGRPGDYLSLGSPVEWKGIDAHRALWEKSLREIYNCDREGDDQSMVQFIKRLFGYAMTGLVVEKIFPVFYGKTGWNGRSLIIEKIKHVMGTLAAPIPSEMLLSQKFSKSSSGPSPDLMILKGVRMAFASEIDDGQRFSNAKIKYLTGRNEISARNPHDKYQSRFDPTHTLFVETNIQPSAPADDKSFWERLLLIQHNISFVNRDPRELYERRANLNLEKELSAEDSGILAWMVEGCLEWQRDGLNPPRSVTEATEQYRMDEDMLGDWVEECCYREPAANEKAADLFKSFVEWYHDNIGKGDKLTGTWFGKQLSKKFDKKKSNGSNVYIGISLKNNQGGLETTSA